MISLFLQAIKSYHNAHRDCAEAEQKKNQLEAEIKRLEDKNKKVDKKLERQRDKVWIFCICISFGLLVHKSESTLELYSGLKNGKDIHTILLIHQGYDGIRLAIHCGLVYSGPSYMSNAWWWGGAKVRGQFHKVLPSILSAEITFNSIDFALT